MSTATALAECTETGTAVYLAAYHYLVMHGWGPRLARRLCGLPAPEPTAHAHWERTWTRDTRVRVYGLGLASVLMLAATWQLSALAGSAVTAAAEVAAALVMQRSLRRAAQGKGQAHDGFHRS